MSNQNNQLWKNFETKFRDSNYMARWFITLDLQHFLGTTTNKCKKLVAFRKVNEYIGTNKLYSKETGLIAPDTKLAILTGSELIDYDQFVSAMNSHFLKPTGMHGYLYYQVEVSKELKEFMDLVEPGRLTTRIDAFRLLYKYVKRNNLVEDEKSKEGVCLVKLDKTLSDLLDKPVGSQMRFHQLKNCLEGHFPEEQRKITDGIYPQHNLKDVFLAETLENIHKNSYIRSVIFNEPNCSNKINTSLLATFAGGDTIYSRSRQVINKNSKQVKEIQAILDKAINDMDQVEEKTNVDIEPKVVPNELNAENKPKEETFNRANLTLTVKKLAKVDTTETVLEEKRILDYSLDYNDSNTTRLDDLFKSKETHTYIHRDGQPINITNNFNNNKRQIRYKPALALAVSLAANTAIAYTTYVIYKKDYDFYSSVNMSLLGDMLFCYCIPDIALPYYSLKTLWTAANMFIASSVKK